MQNAVHASQAQAREAPRGDIRLTACARCGFGFNAAFDPALMAYGLGYDNAIPESAAFRAHLDQRADVVSAAVAEDGLVVYGGCGDGAFLRALTERAPHLSAIGIDAAYAGALDAGQRLRFERRFFGGADESLVLDALVCRHVIEHIPDPVAFLLAVRAGLDRAPTARVFFETPALEWILEHGAIWDVFYEHCNYFSAPVLRSAFARAGFEVVRAERVFEGQYHWIEAKLSTQLETSGEGSAQFAAMHEFGTHERLAREALLARLHEARRDGPVALWGAAAKGVTLANLVDPDGELLLGLVDRNPAKQGRYLPVSGHRVLSPEALRENDVALVLVANPQYVEENRRLAIELGARTRVEALH